jgi:hypothetical protein
LVSSWTLSKEGEVDWPCPFEGIEVKDVTTGVLRELGHVDLASEVDVAFARVVRRKTPANGLEERRFFGEVEGVTVLGRLIAVESD